METARAAVRNHAHGRRTVTASKIRTVWKNVGSRRGARYALCGALVGAGAILPGVSGGALAVAFGVYRPLMDALTRPKTALREHADIFIPLAVGWAAGFFLIARGLDAAMSRSETVCAWLFVGLIAGSVPALFREAGKEGRPASARVCFGLCAATLCAGLYLVRHVLRARVEPNFWWYNFCGVLWGAGTVVPGFAAAPIMMALGLYRPVLEDLSAWNVGALASCVPGAVLSAALLSRLAQRLFRRRYADASHAVLGLVCASALCMVPVRYGGAAEILLSALSCGVGFLLSYAVERMGD